MYVHASSPAFCLGFDVSVSFLVLGNQENTGELASSVATYIFSATSVNLHYNMHF